MRVKYTESLEFRIRDLIEKSVVLVLLRGDFDSLGGGYRQTSRVLKKLIERRELVKIGHGVYAKAYTSPYLDEPLIEQGFDVVAREALQKLGVRWESGSAESEYNDGSSQQVPTQNIVRLKSRFRRKISYAGRQLQYERDTNAR